MEAQLIVMLKKTIKLIPLFILIACTNINLSKEFTNTFNYNTNTIEYYYYSVTNDSSAHRVMLNDTISPINVIADYSQYEEVNIIYQQLIEEVNKIKQTELDNFFEELKTYNFITTSDEPSEDNLKFMLSISTNNSNYKYYFYTDYLKIVSPTERIIYKCENSDFNSLCDNLYQVHQNYISYQNDILLNTIYPMQNSID